MTGLPEGLGLSPSKAQSLRAKFRKRAQGQSYPIINHTMPRGFVYIITNKHHTTLYVGLTSNLRARVVKHVEKAYPKSFTVRYNVSKLVYYEVFDSIVASIAREKQLKAGPRKQKEALINKHNPAWNDLLVLISDPEWDKEPLTSATAARAPKYSES